MCPHPLLTPVGHHYCLLRIILTHALNWATTSANINQHIERANPNTCQYIPSKKNNFNAKVIVYQSFIMDVRLVCIHTRSFSHFLVRQQIGNTRLYTKVRTVTHMCSSMFTCLLPMSMLPSITVRSLDRA